MKSLKFYNGNVTSLILSLLGMLLFLSSCTKNLEEKEEVLEPQNQTVSENVFDENTYSFTTIDLWGNKAAVRDMGDYYIFQGDIFLDKKEIGPQLKDSLAMMTASAARIDKRWLDNNVYYTVSGLGISNRDRELLKEAIKEIEDNTYLTFYERVGEPNYIDIGFVNSTEFKAYSNFIGMKGGKQEIRITKRAWDKGTIIHELCHALGLYHEQCRADRDKYINVHFNNIPEEDRYQFKTYRERGEAGQDVGEFDFNSIMLYDSYNRGLIAMTKKDGSTFMAQQYGLSSGDIKGLMVAQPPAHFTFWQVGNPDPIFSPYEYTKSKYLKCPERANVKFKLQRLFTINYSIFNPKYDPHKPFPGYDENGNPIGQLGHFTLDEFEIKLTVSIQNKNTSRVIYTKEVLFNEEVHNWKDDYISVEIPKGFYIVKTSLTGTIKSVNDSRRRKILEKLMYFPKVFLYIEESSVNGKNLYIPKEFGNGLRQYTFIQI
jgi:Astacin (Peptidase family M12A).